MKTIGDIIRSKRKRLGMNQTELGNAVGVSLGAVSGWEKSGIIPDTDNACALADFFGCSLDELLGRGTACQDGAWELFNIITSTYHGKQYYFLKQDGTVYSRESHSDMSMEDAVEEFLKLLRN